MAKIALSAEFEGFSCKFRPPKNIFRTRKFSRKFREVSAPALSKNPAVKQALGWLGGVVAKWAQPLDPPCRTIGYRCTCRTYVFQVSQGIALYIIPPPTPYRREGGVAGGISENSRRLWLSEIRGPAGTLLDFLLRDRHSLLRLLEFF